MTAYYNENEPYAAQWLRNLIGEGLIADGYVDDRSIAEVEPTDLEGFLQCHFFAGLGGWSGALRLAGIPDDYPLWTGSCPCQPFSLAGRQGGFDDERHLWPTWQRLIRECRPAIILGEQVASAAQWLGLVRSDLEAMGYAFGALPVEAASAGAYHLRDRYWFMADDGRGRRAGPDRRQDQQPRRAEAVGASDPGHMADADPARPQGRPVLPERAGQRPARANGMEHANGAVGQVDPVSGRRSQRSCEGTITGPDGAGNGGGMEHAKIVAKREQDDESDAIATGGQTRQLPDCAGAWIVGADGKARRVEPGIRLLAHGVPQRVAKLRALGNAIDLRPAAAFIKAAIGE